MGRLMGLGLSHGLVVMQNRRKYGNSALARPLQ